MAFLVGAGGRPGHRPRLILADTLGLARSSQDRRRPREGDLAEEIENDIGSPYRRSCPEERLLVHACGKGWLFGIHANRVQPEVPGRLFRYRRRCYQILARALVDRGKLVAEVTGAVKGRPGR
jgi:hypothetical protein